MASSHEKTGITIRPELSLPQNCTQQQRDARAQEVSTEGAKYELEQKLEGYPPAIKKVPKREYTLEELAEVEGGFAEGLAESYAAQWARYAAYKLEHVGSEKPPFSEYTAIYGSSELPAIAKNDQWQQDAVFGMQRLIGMFPWFIQSVNNLEQFKESFPIDEESIKNLLPNNQTLASLADAGRLYYISQDSLNGAKAAHGHVMTAPTTLYLVNDLGQLLPLGIQLYPTPSATNPIFTPNDDPNTWLGVKIHAGCADALVYSLYNHATLIHFVMSNVWTCANRTLPVEHPIYAFLKPHFWMTLYATNQIWGSMDEESGAQLKIMGIDIEGQNLMISRLYKDFDFRTYNPSYNFSERGVDDPEKLPNYFYRDDMLKLWSVHYDYVKSMMDLFYTSDSDVVNDYELQAWMSELAAEDGAAIKGLPVDGSGNLATRENLYELLTSIILTATSRHSTIVVSAVGYEYIPANPFLYQLAAPQDSGAVLDLKTVSDSLPPISLAIGGRDLLASASHFLPIKINALGKYPSGFTTGWPAGAEANIEAWQAALSQVSADIKARNQQLDFPYSALDPENTFNSIFN